MRQATVERADIGDGAESDDDYTYDFHDGLDATLPQIPSESTESEGARVIPDSNAFACYCAGGSSPHRK